MNDNRTDRELAVLMFNMGGYTIDAAYGFEAGHYTWEEVLPFLVEAFGPIDQAQFFRAFEIMEFLIEALVENGEAPPDAPV
jgi:hypothetical protein